MKNIFNKTNAPYLASGALAIGTLLTSGIFAVAPYIGFLAPVAALSLGLPFVIGGVVFSAAAIALSAVVIQKNGAIRRQSALLDEEAKEKAELTLKSEEKDAQLTEKDAKISSLEKRLDENEAFHDVVEEREAEISSLKEQLDEKKNEAKALKTRLAEKDAKISSLEKQVDENGSFYDAVDVQKEREARQEKFESRVARRKQEEAETLGSVPKIIELSDKETETPSPENQPTQNGQSWTEWGIGNAKAAARLVVGATMLAATAAPVLVGTLFEESSASPAGDRFGSINGMYSRY